ncbi:tRNA preQ1(34) S-adenosylmethionine ribosyltransferase-isomerase QueA, partial [Candidatus Roizmanbacteria bacterium CG_4_10_14_3_um_filter_33_21]
MKSINQFDYYLPPESIAKQPAVPRDYSRLFVYDTKTNEIVFDKFYNLDKYLPKKSFLVMNDTKVLPARVEMKKATGGKVRVLFLVNEIMSSSQYQVLSIEQNTIRIFVDRKVDVGDKLFFNSQYFVTVTAQEEHIFTVQFDFSIGELFRILEKKGTMPIPLYIKNSPLSRNDLLHKYQTIFARVPVGTRLIGRSAAAPTASLHFTNRLLSKLEKKRINKTFITLHVGMGTFASVTDVNIRQKKLHEEYFEINNETLQLIN